PPVFGTSDLELAAIFAPPSGTNLRIGSLFHDPARPALLLMDPLLTRHFAVLGSTASGKSCTATLILSAIAAEHPNAHIVLLDPHNEYATAFGELAEVIDVDNLQMPFWFFDFEEAVRILVRGGTAQERAGDHPQECNHTGAPPLSRGRPRRDLDHGRHPRAVPCHRSSPLHRRCHGQ